MASNSIAVTLDSRLLKRIDQLVHQQAYPSRSRAIEAAIREKLERMDRGRLARECAKLNPKGEQTLAEEDMSGERSAWPEY